MNGTFEIDGQTSHIPNNEHGGLNPLHGGFIGYDQQNWTIASQTGNSITFVFYDQAQQGFPGDLLNVATYTLTDEPAWISRMVSIPLNEATWITLQAAGFDDLEEVLAKGEMVTVLRTANVHTGGTIHDVTDRLHRELEALAVAAAAAVDLPVAGVDLIIDAVDAPGGVVIEVNEQPGLANHEPRPTAARFLDLLFPETRLDDQRMSA